MYCVYCGDLRACNGIQITTVCIIYVVLYTYVQMHVECPRVGENRMWRCEGECRIVICVIPEYIHAAPAPASCVLGPCLSGECLCSHRSSQKPPAAFTLRYRDHETRAQDCVYCFYSPTILGTQSFVMCYILTFLGHAFYPFKSSRKRIGCVQCIDENEKPWTE